MNLSQLVQNALPDLKGSVVSQLIHDLESSARQNLADELAKSVSRVLLKSLDGFLSVSIQHLSREDAEDLAGAYAEKLNEQLEQLGEATFAYIPLQLAVEVAKKTHGSKSAEANAARTARQAGIEQFRAEVRDVFLAAVGREPAD